MMEMAAAVFLISHPCSYGCYYNYSSKTNKLFPLPTKIKYFLDSGAPSNDCRSRRVRRWGCCCSCSSSGRKEEEEDGGGRRSSREEMLSCGLEQPGGKMVAQLVGAFNELTHRNSSSSSSSSLLLLFNTLKLALPILQSLPTNATHSSRSPLSQALSVALILADLQMDAQVISAAILRQVLESGAMSLCQVRDCLGTATAHLLHETSRLDYLFSSELLHSLDVDHDRDYTVAFRKFCLTYYDFRALILHLALKLDIMRHLYYLPRYKQHSTSLQVLKLHAPLAHALDDYSLNSLLSLELEDLSFRYLFPRSYLYIDAWLRSQADTGIAGTKPLIDTYRDMLLQSLSSDPILKQMLDDISVKGRSKSRYSTMKKLLTNGRKPEEVNDIFGLRVILSPSNRLYCYQELAHEACYRARDIARSLWKEIPDRTKDYIARPKANGYKSLHMAVDIGDIGGRSRPLMEIQIRTDEMDRLAADGTASHALYKSGLTDPQEAKRLKAIMIAAAELAALRVQDLPSKENRYFEVDQRNQGFSLLDKNSDGKISMEELVEVMEELGAQGEDAQEMMLLLDSNSDGSLSSEELDSFQKQVELMRNLEAKDYQYRTLLDEKLLVFDGSGFS